MQYFCEGSVQSSMIINSLIKCKFMGCESVVEITVGDP